MTCLISTVTMQAMERTMSKHHVTASRLATPVVAVAIAILAAGLEPISKLLIAVDPL